MTMARYTGVVTDDAGNIVPNATIEVRREIPGQPLAALKSDRAGVSAISNPFTAEADGTFAFHVAGGAYQIRAYTISPAFEATPRRYVPIGLAAESDGVDGIDAGILFSWDTGTTDADPLAGNIRANNASMAVATFLYISKTSRGASDVESFLLALDDSTSAVKGTIVLSHPTDESQSTFGVTAVTDATDYVKVAVSNHSGTTSFTAADEIALQFYRTGDKGNTGAAGIDGASALTVVRVVATTNINLASGLVNGASYDGVTLATGELALLAGQTAPSENGVYPVVASGAASRATAFAAYNDHPGRYFSVMEGTAGADKLYRCTSDKGGTLGTTAITISEFSSGGTAGHNRIINPSGMIAQAGLASTADGAYTGFDQWIALTQSNPVTPSAQTNVENGTPYMMRLTQANASAQRFGLLQWLESANCIDLRGRPVFLTARVRASASTTLRYAIVEWTGTADTITKDIVNSWTNTTFTAGQFFTSTTTTIVATGSVALTANTLASIALSGTVSGSMNNLAVFFWTDSTQAQNVTLDIGNVDLKRSLVASAFEARSYQEELHLCKRYYQKIALAPSALAIDGYTNTVSANVALNLPLSPSMRATPSASSSGTPTVSNLNSATPGFQSSADYSQAIWVVTAANTRYFVITNASGTNFLFDARL